MILNKKLAPVYLFVSALLCFGCASEGPSAYLPISTDFSDERSDRERHEELDAQLKEKAAQYCDIDQLENTATKVIAAIFPEKDLSGRLRFLYSVYSEAIDIHYVNLWVAEVHEDGERNPLRVMIFDARDCRLWSMKVAT